MIVREGGSWEERLKLRREKGGGEGLQLGVRVGRGGEYGAAGDAAAAALEEEEADVA